MDHKAILVTGASSGIGQLLTQQLASQGHSVYAGARAPDDLKALAAVTNVKPLRLDLTDSASIAAAVEEVAAAGTGLYAIVNNAGVGTVGSVLDGCEAELDLVLSVNVRGTYRVTRAFAPLVIEQRGRIVIIGSISGILAGKNLSAYSMSKHAMEAFADSLAQEMAPLQVAVSVVEPGAFRTRLAENIKRRMGTTPELPDLSVRDEPHEAVLAVIRALFDTHPRRRYLAAATRTEAHRTLRKQIEQLIQLNQGHAFSLSRDELVRLLDVALEESAKSWPQEFNREHDGVNATRTQRGTGQ